MNEKYLISVAIGPVQDFIASSRRSRDLWFGSWLLSEISRAAAEFVIEKNGELIFPTDLKENVVNKILAIINKPDEHFDKELREKIDNKLKAIYVDIFDDIDKRTSGKNIFYRTEAEQQIKDMYEVYWAAIPYFESEYVICRKKVEQLLNGRKTTRNFNQVTAKDSGKKMPREAMLRNPRSTVSVNR